MMNRTTPLVLAAALGLTGAGAALAQSAEILKEVRLELPEAWSPVESPYANLQEIRRAPAPAERALPDKIDWQARLAPRMFVSTEERSSREEALARLAEIAAEWPASVSYLEVDGWPAIQRRYRRPLQRTAEDKVWVADDQLPLIQWVTTAIAYDQSVVRIEGAVADEGGGKISSEIAAAARAVSLTRKGDPAGARRALSRLRSMRLLPKAAPRAAPPPPGSAARAAIDAMSVVEVGAPVAVHGGVGEIEIAASNNGQVVVIGANSGRSRSTDGGETFVFGGGTPGPACCFDGDPSLAVGASGTFYYAYIAFPNGTAAWNNTQGCSTGVSASTDNGQTFPFRGNAFLSPLSGATVTFPDQEHIAADRVNAAPGGDQVYSVWRDFSPAGGTPNCNQIGSGFVTPSIVCSQDGGANWTARAAIGTGDFPRVSVGQDGSVYAVYSSGGNIMLNKYSSCAAGLVQQAGFPVTVAAFTNVVCPVPGLDRCNDGNQLTSQMVAVDDTNANHVYVAYATSTGGGNENVVVTDSLDGGLTWPNSVTINAGGAARRFMPWVCTTEGNAYVTWYDRRAATAASNDLTTFFLGSATSVGGALVAGPEINVSQVADPQCASGWPCVPRSSNDSESCSVQPQQAGSCSVSGARCDFSAGCPAGAGVCQTGGGCPKYGDYNGIACANGWVFASWSSASAPPGVTAPGGGISVYHSRIRVGAAPVADADGPYSTTEGTPVPLDGSGSEDAGPGALTFEWDFDGGAFTVDAVGPTPNFTAVQQNGVFPVTLRVTDVDGNSDTDSSTVTVLNAPPSVNAGPDQTAFEDEETSLAGAVYTDPGVLDTHTATIDWGDGTPATPGVVVPGAPGSGSVTGSHTYPDPGVYTVTVTVTDSDGASDSDTKTITVVHGFLRHCLFGFGDRPRADRVDVRKGVFGDCRVGADARVRFKRRVELQGGVRSYLQKVRVGKDNRLTGDVQADANGKVKRRSEITGDVTARTDLVLRRLVVVDGDATAGGVVDTKPSTTVTGSVSAGAAVAPSPVITPVTLALIAGGSDVSLARNETRALAPGSYGQVESRPGAVLELSSGRYRFTRLALRAASQIHVDLSGGPVIVDVTGELRLGRRNRIVVTSVAGGPEDVFFQKQGPGRVRLKRGGRYVGTFLAPDGDLKLGRWTVLEGALYGREANAKRGAEVRQRPALDVFVSLFLP